MIGTGATAEGNFGHSAPAEDLPRLLAGCCREQCWSNWVVDLILQGRSNYLEFTVVERIRILYLQSCCLGLLLCFEMSKMRSIFSRIGGRHGLAIQAWNNFLVNELKLRLSGSFAGFPPLALRLCSSFSGTVWRLVEFTLVRGAFGLLKTCILKRVT